MKASTDNYCEYQNGVLRRLLVWSTLSSSGLHHDTTNFAGGVHGLLADHSPSVSSIIICQLPTIFALSSCSWLHPRTHHYYCDQGLHFNHWNTEAARRLKHLCQGSPIGRILMICTLWQLAGILRVVNRPLITSAHISTTRLDYNSVVPSWSNSLYN